MIAIKPLKASFFIKPSQSNTHIAIIYIRLFAAARSRHSHTAKESGSHGIKKKL